MNEDNFKETIKDLKNKGFVLNKSDDNEPVILKHDKGNFKAISNDEFMEKFNDQYTGKNVYEVSEVTRELIQVEISNYKK